MARGSALLTEYERESIAGKHGDQARYEAISRAPTRMQEELVIDVELFTQYKLKLMQELREEVCE